MSASLLRSLPRLADEELEPQTVSKAFWAAATARSTSLALPAETLVKSLPVEGFTTLRLRKGQREFGEIEEGGQRTL